LAKSNHEAGGHPHLAFCSLASAQPKYAARRLATTQICIDRCPLLLLQSLVPPHLSQSRRRSFPNPQLWLSTRLPPGKPQAVFDWRFRTCDAPPAMNPSIPCRWPIMGVAPDAVFHEMCWNIRIADSVAPASGVVRAT
jgi:hypothetical protein